MSNIGCRIRKDFKRPNPELIAKFRGIPVANLDDCMNRVAAVHQDIRPYNRSELLGPALTVKVPEGDNLMFHAAMDLAQPGDVIVIDAGGCTNRSIFGEIMVAYLRTKKIAGIVIDGAIRDVADMEKMDDCAIYARGVTPDGPYKNGPGEINTTISCGGRTVRPGDIVIGDRDGVLFIRPEDAEPVLEKVKALMANEVKIMRAIQEEGSYIRPWMQKRLEELDVEYL